MQPLRDAVLQRAQPAICWQLLLFVATQQQVALEGTAEAVTFRLALRCGDDAARDPDLFRLRSDELLRPDQIGSYLAQTALEVLCGLLRVIGTGTLADLYPVQVVGTP